MQKMSCVEEWKDLVIQHFVEEVFYRMSKFTNRFFGKTFLLNAWSDAKQKS